MKIDILIVGGGIAGLWLLAESRARGYNAYLATDCLGEGQTIASQGIIHGGTKYALTGNLSQATLAIGDMPRIWRDALQGKGNVDLSDVPALTNNQLLWTSGGIGSRMTGFFASKAMKSRMQAVEKSNYPTLFKHSEFKGSLYQLDEPVLDVPCLLQSFQRQYSDYLIEVDTQQSGLVEQEQQYAYQAVLPNGESYLLEAQQIVLTAGAGNESLTQALSQSAPKMQRRPLQMIMVKGDLPPLYAHALGMSDKPRITVTSHKTHLGETVWYIGGQPAEQGVGKPAEQVIQSTQQVLKELLPWLDQSGLQWATWCVDRAEGLQTGGLRPDKPVLHQISNVTTAWVTKLAFAPMLSHQWLSQLQLQPINQANYNESIISSVKSATPIWDRATFLNQ